MKPKVLVVGSTHLNPTEDMVQISDDEFILLPKREEEIKEVVEKLKSFNPTKVAVEIEKKEQDVLTQKYQKYINDSFKLPISEAYQIGFRLAKELSHKNVYAIDWMEIIGQRALGDVFDWAEIHQHDLFEIIQKDLMPGIYFKEDAGSLSILEILKKLNNLNRVKIDHKIYMHIARIGENINYVGIDWLRWWYQRNLIIYSNLIKLIENENDRIILIIGAAHIHLVNQFLQESGLVDVECVGNYL